MSGKIGVCLLGTLLLTTAPSAMAQQPKNSRGSDIWLFRPSLLSWLATRHSDKVCASLGTWRERTLSLSGDLRRENSIASRRSSPS